MLAIASSPCTTVPQDEIEVMDDMDSEVLQNSSPETHQYKVYYDIIYSPSYQVPVLYLSVKPPGGTPPMSLDQVYDLLIPAELRGQIRSVGVMGALSMTDHPISGLPVYFVHPCRTAEAMAEIIQGKEDNLSPEEYLLMWLGLVGPSVGLSVPIELAKTICGATADRVASIK